MIDFKVRKMKKEKILTIGRYALGLALTAISILSVFPELAPEVANFLGLVPEYGVFILANTPVTGTVTSQKIKTAEAGHQERDISKVVTEIKPDEFPLDTMLRNIRSAEKAKNEKVEYETVVYRERNDALTAVNTAAGTSADNSVALSVGKVNMWGVDDTIFVPSITTGTTDSKALRLHVTSVNRAGNTIQVSALNATTETRVPTIANATPIYRMATAKAELDSTTDIITQVPRQESDRS